MTLGDRIHYLRTEKGYTLQELGDKVGVGASTVRKWETGYIKTLRTDKMQKLFYRNAHEELPVHRPKGFLRAQERSEGGPNDLRGVQTRLGLSES